MQPVSPAPRRDPAPSRIAYRLHRLWLTPMFRLWVRVILPALVTFALASWYLSQPATREMLRDKFVELRRSIAERPEFMVRLMAIDGASDSVADDIREILPVDFPISSFDLDLPAMQARIAELDAVEKVDLQIRSGGVLQVTIKERTPAAVWRVHGDLELLDAEGRRVAVIGSRLERADLPLLAGAGAEEKVPEALAILEAAKPVAARIRGLVRVGERRWDLVLDRGQRILLPERNPVMAMEQVMALDQAQDLLSRDVVLVDMRKPSRPTLRLTAAAMDELARIRVLKTGAN